VGGEPVTPVWTPTPEVVEGANTTRFAQAHGLAGHEELLRRSIDDPEWFWDAVVRWLDLGFHRPYTRVLDASRGPEWPAWFVGGRLNLAWSCVGRHAVTAPEEEALVAEREDGTVEARSYGRLAEDVAALAGGLRSLGVERGDRVALVTPMSAAAVTGLYAVAWLGAIVVPIFSGFPASAIAARLVDSGAVAVITVDSGTRRGRPVPIKETVDAAVATAPDVRHVVVARHGGGDVPWTGGRDVWWEDATGAAAEPCWVPSEHPVMLAYTSGTTGRPKGAVHVHGGLLVKLAQEAHFQADLRPGDRLSWITDMGWIMGPWATIGTHAGRGTLVVLDGAPDYPRADRTFRLAERHRLSFLGVSPTLVRALRSHGSTAYAGVDLSSLRAFGSTGEPWNTEPYMWLFRDVGGGRIPIINISGGTEVGACFLACDLTRPIAACSLGRPALGMAVDVWDEAGRPIRDGAVGELVCTKPWPGMTRGMWGDPQRYLETYWSRWPGVWVHGDWASVDAGGDWYLHGRSDDTLNVAGKRIGPAEYESALVGHPAVAEACAVGIPDAVKGESAWCFVVLRAGAEPGEALRAELTSAVVRELGAAFRPGAIRFAETLPRTRSAKIVRRAVRAAVMGEDPGDLSTLEDPAAVDAIRTAC
jgi:acetyl-CoA synthetase